MKVIQEKRVVRTWWRLFKRNAWCVHDEGYSRETRGAYVMKVIQEKGVVRTWWKLFQRNASCALN